MLSIDSTLSEVEGLAKYPGLCPEVKSPLPSREWHLFPSKEQAVNAGVNKGITRAPPQARQRPKPLLAPPSAMISLYTPNCWASQPTISRFLDHFREDSSVSERIKGAFKKLGRATRGLSVADGWMGGCRGD